MLSTKLYIDALGIICAAGNNVDEHTPAISDATDNKRLAVEPEYKSLIPPMQLRRMSKAVRMGIAGAKACVQRADVEMPDAISVGTAMGCVHDTEQFLTKMIGQNEQMLTPTSFIQSTHNTVSGAIALTFGCKGHNLTFVHRGHSFEHALLNASVYLNEHSGETMLAGGIDELVDASFEIKQRAKIYKSQFVPSEQLYEADSFGSIGGEGAAFYLLRANRSTKSFMAIEEINCFVSKSFKTAVERVRQFLAQHGDFDAVLLGASGDQRSNYFYRELIDADFANTPKVFFKHLTGEYHTASAVGLGLLANTLQGNSWNPLQQQILPNAKRILFINNYLFHYSCYVLEIL